MVPPSRDPDPMLALGVLSVLFLALSCGAASHLAPVPQKKQEVGQGDLTERAARIEHMLAGERFGRLLEL